MISSHTVSCRGMLPHLCKKAVVPLQSERVTISFLLLFIVISFLFFQCNFSLSRTSISLPLSVFLQALRKRPKFEKLSSIPNFLQRKDDPEHELRDYQLEGINWMLHAWTKLVLGS